MIGDNVIGVNDGLPKPPDMAAQLWAAWRRAYPAVERTDRKLAQLPNVVKGLAGWPFALDDPRVYQLADALAAIFADTIAGAAGQSYTVLDQLRVPDVDQGHWWCRLHNAFERRAVERYREKAASTAHRDGGAPPVIAGLVREREPFVIGGAEKTMKTCLAIDLAAAVATGTSFLGRDVAAGDPCGVWALTLETQPALWVERFERAVKARGCDVGAARKWLTVTDDLRSLRKKSGRAELSAFIDIEFVKLAIIDPLYLALPPVSSADLSAQGSALRKLVRPIVKAGAAPVLVAHFTKSAAVGAVPSLHDLAGSAVGPFARSWLLVARTAAYAGDGRHQLAALIGSSAGDCSTAAVKFDELAWSLDSGPIEIATGKGRRNASPFGKKGA